MNFMRQYVLFSLLGLTLFSCQPSTQPTQGIPDTTKALNGTQGSTDSVKLNPFERGQRTYLFFLNLMAERSDTKANDAVMGGIAWLNHRCVSRGVDGLLRFGTNSDFLLNSGANPPIHEFFEEGKSPSLSMDRTFRATIINPTLKPGATEFGADLQLYENRAGKWREKGMPVGLRGAITPQQAGEVIAHATFVAMQQF